MRDMNDARGLPFLVDRSGVRFHELLRHLQRGRPADPVLVALTNRHDPDTRRRAAYALADSQDPALAAVVIKLASDESPDVRHEAASMGANLADPAFREVRPALIRLLSDPVIDVKAYAAQIFAYRKDPVCAEALLQLLVDEQKLVDWQQSNTVQAVHNLTGAYFGFQPGTVLGPEARRVALQKFAAWIRRNGPSRE
jgi:HEAT repeat protein